MSVTESLEAEMKRIEDIITECEAMATVSFAAAWLRALVRRGEQAIRDGDLVACAACLKQMREFSYQPMSKPIAG